MKKYKDIVIPVHYIYGEENNEPIIDEDSIREEFERQLKELLEE